MDNGDLILKAIVNGVTDPDNYFISGLIRWEFLINYDLLIRDLRRLGLTELLSAVEKFMKEFKFDSIKSLRLDELEIKSILDEYGLTESYSRLNDMFNDEEDDYSALLLQVRNKLTPIKKTLQPETKNELPTRSSARIRSRKAADNKSASDIKPASENPVEGINQKTSDCFNYESYLELVRTLAGIPLDQRNTEIAVNLKQQINLVREILISQGIIRTGNEILSPQPLEQSTTVEKSNSKLPKSFQEKKAEIFLSDYQQKKISLGMKLCELRLGESAKAVCHIGFELGDPLIILILLIINFGRDKALVARQVRNAIFKLTFKHGTSVQVFYQVFCRCVNIIERLEGTVITEDVKMDWFQTAYCYNSRNFKNQDLILKAKLGNHKLVEIIELLVQQEIHDHEIRSLRPELFTREHDNSRNKERQDIDSGPGTAMTAMHHYSTNDGRQRPRSPCYICFGADCNFGNHTLEEKKAFIKILKDEIEASENINKKPNQPLALSQRLSLLSFDDYYDDDDNYSLFIIGEEPDEISSEWEQEESGLILNF